MNKQDTRQMLTDMLRNAEDDIYLSPIAELHDIYNIPDDALWKSPDGQEITYREVRENLKTQMTHAQYHTLKKIVDSVYGCARYIGDLSVELEKRTTDGREPEEEAK